MPDLRNLFNSAAEATREGNHSQAIRVYEEILDLAPPNSEARHLAHWGIGDIHLNHQELSKAESHFLSAIEIKPNVADYHYLLGCCYTYADRINDAIESLEKALEIKPESDVILGQLGWVIGHNVDVDKGIKFCKKSLSINPMNSGSLRDLCMLFCKQTKFGEALVCIEEAERHNQTDPLIAEVRAKVEFFRKQFDDIPRPE